MLYQAVIRLNRFLIALLIGLIYPPVSHDSVPDVEPWTNMGLLVPWPVSPADELTSHRHK